jgi:hypothetical protein
LIANIYATFRLRKFFFTFLKNFSKSVRIVGLVGRPKIGANDYSLVKAELLKTVRPNIVQMLV